MKPGAALTLLLLFGALCSSLDLPPRLDEFPYQRYGFRKNKKNDKVIKAVKQRCEVRGGGGPGGGCVGLYGVEQLACVRRCMSPLCYQQLYAYDELEEGEIDVRYNSFKGCILENQRHP